MSEEQAVMEAPAPETPDVAEAPEAAQPERQPEQAQRPIPDEIVDIARDLGWVPQDEFKGNPATWIPADAFVRNTARINKDMRKKVDGLTDTVNNMASVSEKLMRKQLAEQRAELERKFQMAVDLNDPQAARQAMGEITKLDQESASSSHREKFKAENPWFEADDDATAYAIAVAGREAAKGANPEQQLAKAAEAVRKRFPELFPQDKQESVFAKAPPVMQGGSRAAPPKKKSYPPEVMRAAESFVRKGMVKDTAEYLKMYDAEVN